MKHQQHYPFRLFCLVLLGGLITFRASGGEVPKLGVYSGTLTITHSVTIAGPPDKVATAKSVAKIAGIASGIDPSKPVIDVVLANTVHLGTLSYNRLVISFTAQLPQVFIATTSGYVQIGGITATVKGNSVDVDIPTSEVSATGTFKYLQHLKLVRVHP